MFPLRWSLDWGPHWGRTKGEKLYVSNKLRWEGGVVNIAYGAKVARPGQAPRLFGALGFGKQPCWVFVCGARLAG